jgi:hypothetical protein
MHYLAVYTDLSAIRAIGPGENPNERAFAGAVVSYQTNDLAPTNTEVSTLQRLDMTEMPDNTPPVD